MAQGNRLYQTQNHLGSLFSDQQNNFQSSNHKEEEDSREEMADSNKPFLKKPQLINERKQITNIFTELIIIINAHSKDNIFRQSIEPTEFALPGQFPTKTKINKIIHFDTSPTKSPNQPEITISGSEQTSVSFLIDNPEILKTISHQLRHKMGENQNNKSHSCKKCDKYEPFMTYRIHPIEDQANSFAKSPKIKHPQFCSTECSIACSPRKAEDRKLSIKIMKDESQSEMIGENERMLRICPQFYIKLSNKALQMINYVPQAPLDSSAISREDHPHQAVR